MTQTIKKKLIEVAIPLEAINAACAREKSIARGHPSTVHMWWARRPLTACRAILFAQLVDDPSSHPDKFPDAVSIDAERKRLFSIINELVKWENGTNYELLELARTEIKNSNFGELPAIHDPFSGGGSIPLEAQRLGLTAYGSDLNPVAVMIGKATIEIPGKFKNMEPFHPGIKEKSLYRNADGLVEDIRFYANWMRDQAWNKIGHLYAEMNLPSEYGSSKAKVIAWVWARTVPSPDPAFENAQTPIAANFAMNYQNGKRVIVEPKVNKTNKTVTFQINNQATDEEMKLAKQGVKVGRGANFRCLFSGSTITPDHVRRSAKNGLMGQKLICIIVQHGNVRLHLSPTEAQEQLALSEKPIWRPEVPLAKAQYIGVHRYGCDTFGDLFTDRNLIALNTFTDLISEVNNKIITDFVHISKAGQDKALVNEYAKAITMHLAMATSKMSAFMNKQSRWRADRNQTAAAFAMQTIPMVWDFAETNPFSGAGGDFIGIVEGSMRTLSASMCAAPGFIQQADAQTQQISVDKVVSTDPPYYDNIPYADLSDFFYVWLQRSLKKLYPDNFSTLSVPKMEELVADKMRHGGEKNAEKFFMEGMKQAISNFRSQARENCPATIYYAFKQSEIELEGVSSTGWATFLEAVIKSGYAVVRTWPIRTEMATRMRASGSNALANSVVMVCRPQSPNAQTITRAEFTRILKRELPPAISELQAANVSPADMPQSAIGPGIGLFSSYMKILEPDDSPMTVKTALQLINSELDEFLNNFHGDFDPDTRFSATWFEQNGYEKGDFGAANSLATARGISVDSVKHAGIVESSAGKVRILKREELDPNWEPNSDTHLTVWECCQYLVREYEDGGETAAAMLIKKMGFEKADAVKDLAYYLYDICSNKRQDAKEATSYNALIAGWNDIMRMANSIHDTDTTRQASLF